MSLLKPQATAESLPLLHADPLAPMPGQPTAPLVFEPMPPVPAEELDAALHYHPGGIFRGIVNHWRQLFPERPFDPDRRRVVRNLAILGLAASQVGQAAYLNHELRQLNGAMEAHWPASEPSLNFIGEAPSRPRELAIFYPGFGDPSPRKEAGVLKAKGHIDPGVPITYLDYSSRGPGGIAQLERAVRKAVPTIDSVESLTSIDRSLGGPYSIGVEARLGRPVKLKIVSSSPLEEDDADFATIGATLAELPDARFLDAGIKYGMSLWSDASKEKPDTPWGNFSAAALSLFESFGGHGNFHDALNKTMEALDQLTVDSARAWGAVWYGVDPLALQHELQTWRDEHLTTDPSKLYPDFLRGIRRAYIPGFTKFYYTATDHPSTDTTVRVIAGAYHWRDFMLNVAKLPPEDVKILGLPYNGHANLGVTFNYMAPLMEKDTQPSNVLADG